MLWWWITVIICRGTCHCSCKQETVTKRKSRLQHKYLKWKDTLKRPQQHSRSRARPCRSRSAHIVARSDRWACTPPEPGAAPEYKCFCRIQMVCARTWKQAEIQIQEMHHGSADSTFKTRRENAPAAGTPSSAAVQMERGRDGARAWPRETRHSK